jgi:CubicO group peptidase (beta-lactamase class C family)
LEPDTQPLDPECTFELASAGKFVTHISVLQCVERGLISLDEPVYRHLPELEEFGIISPNTDADATEPFTLRPRTRDITVRHLLLHASGIGHDGLDIIQQWRKAIGGVQEQHPLVHRPSMPLSFEPGNGWLYGSNIYASQLLLERLSGMKTEAYTQENIFRPLNMTSTTYLPGLRSDVCERALKKVERRKDGKVYIIDEPMYGLSTSASDFRTLAADLMSPSSKILTKESLDLLFQPQFAPSSPPLAMLRSCLEDYEYVAGIPRNMKNPAS